MSKYCLCDWRPFERNTLKGFFSLKIDSITFQGFSLHVKEETGARWIGLPSREYVENGERKYSPTVTFESKERKNAFQEWALNELDKLLAMEVKPQSPPPAKPRLERDEAEMMF